MLINFENLKSWLGYKNKAQVKNWLSHNNIPFEQAKNGEPVTTTKAINSALFEKNKNLNGWDNVEF